MGYILRNYRNNKNNKQITLYNVSRVFCFLLVHKIAINLQSNVLSVAKIIKIDCKSDVKYFQSIVYVHYQLCLFN